MCHVNRTLRALVSISFLAAVALTTGCYNCDIKTTTVNLTEQNDDFLILEYHMWPGWLDDSKKSDYCTYPLEFWIRVKASEWYEGKTGQRPQLPWYGLPYEIIAREKVKPQKLFQPSELVYTVRIRTEDIVKAAEKQQAAETDLQEAGN